MWRRKTDQLDFDGDFLHFRELPIPFVCQYLPSACVIAPLTFVAFAAQVCFAISTTLTMATETPTFKLVLGASCWSLLQAQR